MTRRPVRTPDHLLAARMMLAAADEQASKDAMPGVRVIGSRATAMWVCEKQKAEHWSSVGVGRIAIAWTTGGGGVNAQYVDRHAPFANGWGREVFGRVYRPRPDLTVILAALWEAR